MSTHSWHHYERWGELHPYSYRKYQQRRRRDNLRAAFGICEAQLKAGRNIADWDDVMPRGVYRAMIAALRKEIEP